MNPDLSQKNPKVAVERIFLEYKGKRVKGRRLLVSTVLPINIEKAWENVQTPELLQFVAQGMITFKPVDGTFPRKWEVGKTYGAKMLIFGWIPFGGVHYLHILTVDPTNFRITTKEWDSSAKVWNHEVRMNPIAKDVIRYEDVIDIYGGFMTGFITAFAKRFYRHRQKRWQIVARENLEFGK